MNVVDWVGSHYRWNKCNPLLSLELLSFLWGVLFLCCLRFIVLVNKCIFYNMSKDSLCWDYEASVVAVSRAEQRKVVFSFFFFSLSEYFFKNKLCICFVAFYQFSVQRTFFWSFLWYSSIKSIVCVCLTFQVCFPNFIHRLSVYTHAVPFSPYIVALSQYKGSRTWWPPLCIKTDACVTFYCLVMVVYAHPTMLHNSGVGYKADTISEIRKCPDTG